MADVVEQDTIQSENTSDIVGYIRDGMPDSDKCLQEGFLFNRRVFNGWVKQPSACCAAASVAGAFNALACLQRGDEGPLNHSDILRIYESMFIDLIAKHKADFQRRLGAPIDDILVSIEKELKDIGREVGGAKGHNATKTSVANAILKICRKRAAAPQSEGTATASAGKGRQFECVRRTHGNCNPHFEHGNLDEFLHNITYDLSLCSRR
jgi:hypothetical protein